VYGHVNNAVYGEWIDSIVNHYLIKKCSLNPLKSPIIGFVVSSYCSYYSPISYPDQISIGLFVKRIGNSSVDYTVGIFENCESKKASAVGGFTHVFVDRINRRPQKIDDEMKKKLLSISNLID
jgi:acyl-CoA thioester hydrolase